jgi:XRE family aerobic/anaerobic benzoate catabolism transcriptional regulator
VSQQPTALPTEDGDAIYLARLGERVRETRARRGMSRKALAQASGVSERYLAQLEGGEGNVSVLLLRQIAQALDVAETELLRDREPQSTEIALVLQFLRRLPPAALTAVRQRLVQEFGDAPLKRRQRIALIGLRGAGKSTLGARLADALDAPFIELDREVELEAGTTLSEIFLTYGQPGYRRYELRALERALQTHERCVIATGGSIVSEPATYELLLSTCFTVWLKAAPEEHMARVIAQGDMRPMAGNVEAMDDLRRILEGRAPLYAQADAVVDTAGRTAEQSLAALERVVSSARERTGSAHRTAAAHTDGEDMP